MKVDKKNIKRLYKLFSCFIIIVVFNGCAKQLFLGGGSLDIFEESKNLQVQIIDPPADCPLEIIEFKSTFDKSRKKWKVWLEVRNISSNVILRHDCHFTLYNVYGEVVNKLSGFSEDPIHPGKKDHAGWEKKIYSGQAYSATVKIYKVAYDGGEVWQY